jgi:hypothetical protein
LPSQNTRPLYAITDHSPSIENFLTIVLLGSNKYVN